MRAQDMAVFRAMRSVRRCARFPLKLPNSVAPDYSKGKGSVQAVRKRTKKGRKLGTREKDNLLSSGGSRGHADLGTGRSGSGFGPGGR